MISLINTFIGKNRFIGKAPSGSKQQVFTVNISVYS